MNEQQLSTGKCECAQVLWTAVDNPVDNSSSRGRDSMPVLDLKISDFVRLGALEHACELLSARVEALELQLIEIYGVLNSPLTMDERIDRIRQIRRSV